MKLEIKSKIAIKIKHKNSNFAAKFTAKFF